MTAKLKATAEQIKYDRIKAKNDAAGRTSGPRPSSETRPMSRKGVTAAALASANRWGGQEAVEAMNDNAGMIRKMDKSRTGLAASREATKWGLSGRGGGQKAIEAMNDNAGMIRKMDKTRSGMSASREATLAAQAKYDRIKAKNDRAGRKSTARPV